MAGQVLLNLVLAANLLLTVAGAQAAETASSMVTGAGSGGPFILEILDPILPYLMKLVQYVLTCAQNPLACVVLEAAVP